MEQTNDLQKQIADLKQLLQREQGKNLDLRLENKDLREENIDLKGTVEKMARRVSDLEKSNMEITSPSAESVKNVPWKGKDQPTISKIGDIWVWTEHRNMDKHGSDIKEINKTIPHLRVVELFDILINLTSEERKNDPRKYKKEPVKLKSRAVWARLMERHNLSDVEIDAFNGGKNRAKYYFPLFYYPMKILEHLKKVEYKASGQVIVQQELLFFSKEGLNESSV
jgi:hypothetical protein